MRSKVLLAGAASLVGAELVNNVPIARFLPDGQLDANFKGGVFSIALSESESYFGGIVNVQPDGMILVSGSIDIYGGAGLARLVP